MNLYLPFRQNANQICTLAEQDALSVQSLINAQAPQAPYASYYPAMFANFVPDTSVVAKDKTGNVTGAVLGMYDWQLKTLIVSHVVTALTDISERHRQVSQMLKKAFGDAAAKGVTSVVAHLDMTPDAGLERILEREASRAKVSSHIEFNGQTDQQPDAFIPPDKKAVISALKADPGAITYRHPTLEDARALWSLVMYINKELGGLDRYALSNFERLCRDTPETCMVAEYDGKIGAFATGFRIPDETGEKGLFMWQTGSLLPGAGYGCEERLLDELQPDYLSFTVEGDNGAANRTAVKKAEHLKVAWSNPRAIPTEALGNGHKPEVIYTVGSEETIQRVDAKLLKLTA